MKKNKMQVSIFMFILIGGLFFILLAACIFAEWIAFLAVPFVAYMAFGSNLTNLD